MGEGRSPEWADNVILEWPPKLFLSDFIAHSVVLYYSVLVKLVHFTLLLTYKIERQIWLTPPPQSGHLVIFWRHLPPLRSSKIIFWKKLPSPKVDDVISGCSLTSEVVL